MKTLVAVGRSTGHEYTMQIEHILPLSAEWYEKNGARVVPSLENGFATGPCDCNIDRCENHDIDAEAAYWAGTFAAPVADPYEPSDPKSEGYAERAFEAVGR